MILRKWPCYFASANIKLSTVFLSIVYFIIELDFFIIQFLKSDFFSILQKIPLVGTRIRAAVLSNQLKRALHTAVRIFVPRRNWCFAYWVLRDVIGTKNHFVCVTSSIHYSDTPFGDVFQAIHFAGWKNARIAEEARWTTVQSSHELPTALLITI